VALLPRTKNTTPMPPQLPLPAYLAKKGYVGEGRSLKLKRILLRHNLTIAELSRSVVQASGATFARPTMQELVTYGIAPVKTPFADIKRQVEVWLMQKGVSAAEIATAMEVEDDGVVELRANPTTAETIGARTALAAKLRAAGVAEDLIETTVRAVRRSGARTPAPKPLVDNLEREMLSPAAMKHFELPSDPFGEEIHDAADIFRGSDVNEVREHLWKWANGSALGALIGECGSGKSWLRQDLEDRIAKSPESVRLIRPQTIDVSRMTARTICEAIILDIDPSATIPQSVERQAHLVKKLLLAGAKLGRRNVLLIEEAHKLTIDALRHMKVFYELQEGFMRLLSIVLIGQPELDHLLNEQAHYKARETIRRVTKVYMKPLHTSALKPFIEHKFARLGVDAARVLDASGYDAIRADRIKTDQKSKRVDNQCYPLSVQSLIVSAMNTAATIGAPRVDAGVIARAIKERGQ